MNEQVKNDLWERWSYQFKEWIYTLRSAPVELIEHGDYSSGYNKNEFHVFKLENGKYCTIREIGCSCYTFSDADIELFPNKKAAMVKFKEYDKKQKERKMWS